MVAQNSIQYFNCKVDEAENGLEAIEILKTKEFDIILMDIQMPEMDGIEATKFIRNKLNIKTPIIALTANAFKTEIEKCRKAGMDDYVTKPFDETILLETIAKLLNRKDEKEIILKINNMPEDTWLYSMSSINNLSRGNEEFVQKMIAIFIDQTLDTIEKVERALLTNDYPEVSRLIHKIKPSIEGMGILSILDDVKLLEKITKENNKNYDKEEIYSLYSTIKFTLEKVVLLLKENEVK
jgi:CheY-like chemotaxis protein